MVWMRVACTAAVVAGCGVQGLAGQSAPPREAEVLVEQLCGLPAPLPAGGTAARAPEEVRRWHVVNTLRALGQPAVQALATALTDDDVSRRRNAVLAWYFLAAGMSETGRVPRIDISGRVQALTDTLSGDEDSFVRAWSAQALGAGAPPSERAVASLIAALADPWVVSD